MAPELLWLGAAIAGYGIVMACNPVRGYFADGFNLLCDRGRVRLWLPVAMVSLLPVSFQWFGAGQEPTVDRGSRRAFELSRAVAADGAGLYSAVAGLRPAPAATSLPVKSRAALTIGALFWCALVIGQQFFVLTALYLGVVMPERDPGWLGLLSFAWRRLARFWPGLLVSACFTIAALWLPQDGVGAVVLWPLAAATGACFAFLQVGLLSGERGWREALRTNFGFWRKLAYFVLWFLVIAGIQLFLLHLSDVVLSGMVAGKAGLATLWDLAFALIRAAMMVWLLAAWVLLFCSKTKNPSRRRIRP